MQLDLSVIIPIYNAEVYIVECLSALMRYPDASVEFLLVNDGSTDESLAICMDVVKRDERFRVVNKENGGVSSARNRGLVEASGRYVMFLDADDLVLHEALEDMALVVKSKSYDYVAYSYKTLFQSGKIDDEPFDIRGEYSEDMNDAMRIMWTTPSFNTCWGKLYKNQIIKEHNLTFRTGMKIGEDLVFVAEYLKCCNKPLIKNLPFLLYRQHDASAMKKESLDGRLNYLGILYEFSKASLEQLDNYNLDEQMHVYYFRMVTDLLNSFARVSNLIQMSKVTKQVIHEGSVSEIISDVVMNSIPLYKRQELILLRSKIIFLNAVYFSLKAKVDSYRRR